MNHSNPARPPGAALDAAVRLHDFIRANAGETADWPLQITSRDRGAIEMLDLLLRELRDAIGNNKGSDAGQ